ncbi:MAG: pilus assembly protein PilM [Lachnospiraceae bacterium]|nr:pilus assembly protein PilM [Lachnospiraceae bacterium]
MGEKRQLVFGLDIGTRSIVGTVGYKSGKKFVVIAQCNKEHETRAMLDGQIHDIGQVAATIKEVKERLEKQIGSKLNKACIAAAGRVLKTMQTHSEVKFQEDRIIQEEDVYDLHSIAIEDAYKKFLDENNTDTRFYCVGSSVVKYYLNDFPMNSLVEHKAMTIGVDMIATFLPDDVVNGLYRAVELAGLEVSNVTLEPIAAINLAIPERFRLLNIALVDVGAGTSDISITKDGSIIAFGMIPTAGDSLTESIAHHCMVDFNTAEEIKRKGDTDDVIEYEDIMGLPMTITKEELAEAVHDDVDRMATLAADKIMELNGGKSVGAVFVVGGGGVIPGYTKMLAEKLSLPENRVALRGKEVMNDIIFENTDLEINSLLVTPIGIALSFYEESNNFIFVNFNGSKIKLYDNSNLTVMDAAMQTDFPSSSLFPKSGKELNFTVNGTIKMIRGTMGEPAVIKVNSQPANLHTAVKENDIIEVVESQPGEPAHATIGDLGEYKAFIKVNVNGISVDLPKFATVNGKIQSEYYSINDGDVIEILDYMLVDQIVTLMEIDVVPGSVPMVNNEPAKPDTRVYENFSVRWELRDDSYTRMQYDNLSSDDEDGAGSDEDGDPYESGDSYANGDSYEELFGEDTAGNGSDEAVDTDTSGENANASDFSQEEQSDKGEEKKSSSSASHGRRHSASPRNNQVDCHVVVNGKVVTLSGKSSYVFVDVFDFIDFDLSHPQGTVITTLNGRPAQYMEPLQENSVIEVYWKK